MASKRQFVSHEELMALRAKAQKSLAVKSWYMEKEFTQSERYAISTADAPVIESETEKAVLLKWSTDFGTITKWVPRSCLN